MAAMKVVHISEMSLAALVDARRRSGSGHQDECWDGVWHLTDPTARHQQIAARLYRIFAECIEDRGLGSSWISINVTDREEGWLESHRCPDAAVILAGNPGRWIGDRRAAFLGGPDLIVEVRGDEDVARKFRFYASVGVREILVVDRDLGEPELWRRVGTSFERCPPPLVSEVTSLVFARQGPNLAVVRPADGREWIV